MDMYPQGFKANFGLELANTFGVSASIEMVACRWFAGYCVLRDKEADCFPTWQCEDSGYR
jgi:hypothetical protein